MKKLCLSAALAAGMLAGAAGFASAAPMFVLQKADGTAVDGGVGRGETATLGSAPLGTYDPSGNAALLNGYQVNIFGSQATVAGEGEGLYVTGQGAAEDVVITYTFLGEEASYDNFSFETSGGETFNNNTSALDSFKVENYGPQTDPWLVDFQFRTNGGLPVTSPNGAILDPTRIAFHIIDGGQFAIAFWDDGGAGPDADFDDMVMLLSLSGGSNLPVPIPAPLILLLSGIVGLGFLGRYRRKEPAAA